VYCNKQSNRSGVMRLQIYFASGPSVILFPVSSMLLNATEFCFIVSSSIYHYCLIYTRI